MSSESQIDLKKHVMYSPLIEMDREDYMKAKQLLDAVSEKTAPEFPLVADIEETMEG